MRKIKKFLCALMAVLLVLSAVPAYGAEQADDGTEEKPLVQKVERMLTGMRITGAIPASILDYEEFRFGYGQNGELISKLSVTKDGNVDYGTHKEYGPSGQLVSQTYYGPTTTKAEYDESGRILRELELVDGEFVQYRVYQYDDRGLLLEASELIDGEYLPFGIYEYNDRGLLTHEWLRYYADDLEFSYTYEYDDLGRLRKKIDDRFVGMVGPLFCIVEQYEYDDCGRLIYEQPPKTSGAFRYEYDDNGHMTRKTVLVSYDAETQEITGDYRYEYDDAGRLLRTLDLLQSTTDGDSADYHVVEEYTYDAQGLLTTSYEEYDGFQDHMEYQYDNSGKKIKEILTETYLPDTVRKAHGEREYFYNPAGRLVRTLFIEQVTARDGTVHSRTDEVLHFGQFRFSTWVETSSSGETEKTFWMQFDFMKVVDQACDLAGQNVEDIFVGLTPPLIGAAVKGIFATNKYMDRLCQVKDFVASEDESYIRIYTPEAAGSLTISGVTAIPDEDALPGDAVLQVFRIANTEAMIISDEGLVADQYELYDICFTAQNIETHPNGFVTVKIPVPADYDSDKCIVFHQQDDGSWKLIESIIEDDFIVFRVDHFCQFAIVDGRTVTKQRIYGDADGSETVDYMDAMLVLRHAVKLATLSEEAQAVCNVDGVGGIDYMDAMLILRHAVKLIDQFPVETK